jgi:membrane protease YdiL (CAAX protease family)
LTTAGGYVLLGGSWADAAPRFLAGDLALLPLFVLIAALTDGLGEELGWRGFALPRLLSRHAPWVASLVLALLWATWHLPLLWTEGRTLYGQPFWVLLLDLSAKSIIFTWVFLRTRGSVLVAALLHATNNVFGVSPVISVTGSLTLPLIAVALQWVLAALVLLGTHRSFLRPVRDPEVLPPDQGPAVPRDEDASRSPVGSEPDRQPT